MDNKIIAIIAAVIVVVAGVAAFFVLNNGDDKEAGLTMVGRVNSEGSGILLKGTETPTDYITVQTTEPAADAKYIKNGAYYYVFNVNTWGGKVFATPGAATIQHVQLAELASLMGLKYVSYTDGTTPASDTLYYMAGVASYAEFAAKPTNIVGYIIWEAQVSVGIQDGCGCLALTNDLFAGHTCCIIGTSNDYVKKHSDVLETFLYVYSKAVDKLNAAKTNPGSEDYDTILGIAKKRVSMPDSLSDQQKTDAITAALGNVTYLYDDHGNLDKLKADVAALAKSLVDSGVISKSASDLGFSDYNALGQKFVNDTPMKNALSKDIKKFDNKTKITVAAINGDVHQIALWIAIDTGMFAEYNLDVVVSGQSGGPGVWTVIENGEVDIGFLGAPPMTIRSMNAEDIRA